MAFNSIVEEGENAGNQNVSSYRNVFFYLFKEIMSIFLYNLHW